MQGSASVTIPVVPARMTSIITTPVVLKNIRVYIMAQPPSLAPAVPVSKLIVLRRSLPPFPLSTALHRSPVPPL